MHTRLEAYGPSVLPTSMKISALSLSQSFTPLVIQFNTEPYILLMGQQLVLTHTIYETEIPAFLDCWVTNTPSVKISYLPRSPLPKKKISYIFVKTWHA
jgi:hypothetical protein